MNNIDILCVGEVLVDFIGHQTGVLINNTSDYHRYIGGSPTNVAMNSSRLGLNATMIATVGNDGFGAYIFERLSNVGINTNYIKSLDHKSTSVILFQGQKAHQISFHTVKQIIISMMSKFQPKHSLKLKYFIPHVLH